MKQLVLAALYTAAVTLANPAAADTAAAEALREGDMKKLVFHAEPQASGTADFITFEGDPLNLADWRGKWLLVNFWATWCAPCRKEMPMLAEIQSELGGDNFEVVTIATTRNAPPAMKKFFDEVGIANLPLHRDPGSVLAREMGVLGLPVTVILNPDGQEVARLRGDADWSSDSAKAVLRALLPSG
ncbi:TlpA disulfide reductase family protein [Aestuariicoccus sp. MJ-SS9]|uniref:TlpA family protein disulfide reductase n=1 Tax=Aestuariicoccus sp. MJ-SS9 TaxID=3079855 RepID=UPI00290D44A5|nr:TlpA disulfide reductase family protein [Aestuariicoccus sp. MJ-SS9]MDU8910730.1 TlpA disulfide reductase family protein [Aestuariicoccus sp. MJ-SS9]